MKLLIAALLAVFSTSVMAEWTMVSASDVSTHYADLATIRKSGNAVKMWDLVDYKVVQTADGKRVLSLALLNEYACKEETSRLLALYGYSKNMKHGEVVYSYGSLHEEPQHISPGSTDETLIKLACGK